MIGSSQRKKDTSYICTEYRLPGDTRDAVVGDIRDITAYKI